ncbi:MAG: RNA-binding S4 domain-containing protein [Oscillospiraceae bacterium]|nr:RNA-binding S4 domain-containing protein [Oscillospiraceae bacterium]
MNRIVIHTEYITLAQFLKYAGAAMTGGEAAEAVRAGEIKVDGVVCYMRGKKLRGGEKVEAFGEEYQVVSS